MLTPSNSKLSIFFSICALACLNSMSCDKSKGTPEEVAKERAEEAKETVKSFCGKVKECMPDEKDTDCADGSLEGDLQRIHKQHPEKAYETAIGYLDCLGALDCQGLKNSMNESDLSSPCMKQFAEFDKLSKKIKCADGTEVEGKYCDGKKQCEDESDERSDSCFVCDENQTIHKHQVCDGQNNCSIKEGKTAADERDCPAK